nr:phycobilisome rod-core linker polypeptide [Porphyridium purpureum]6KGX_B2 Chain B2, Phycobilisome rod-core linker polypeptide [Porphyridium purpureum]6KGX_B6 Chain B6, Phycobilisome rod-core linker polypeptide [Porphyridium purpureum]6KGX_B7 Chain B7, Phycobilisome rod-core linker polypeptide [Porphyridium purpureum]6KGX_BB Chain BB, Phycobilisome rod-core linker polypeptide [Porphyridium purpureum]6KGX_BF Chain BF, Phycobilisome rod-core linker polypeptide [Porphyridium purpureum]6KGX_BI 
MSIPILKYSLSTQNQRVESFEVNPGDEQYRIYSTDSLPSSSEVDQIIWAAYRQIFSEHQILKSTKQPFLESQLRFNQISIKDFIKGLVLSAPFRDLNYNVNNNYRFVEICVQRVLGRDIYNEREKIAWSIIIATQGLEGFIDTLLNTQEYLSNFGDSIVPFQRRRIIPQRSKGEMPFNLKTPRYGIEFRSKLAATQFSWASPIRRFRPQEQQPKAGDPALFLNMVQEMGPGL